MKKYVLAIVFCLFAVSVMAAPVAVQNAKQVAVNWMKEKTGDSFDLSDITRVFIIKEQLEPVYYAFNIKPEGWIIVSSDNVAYPVIGYSKKGSYGDSNQPPQFQGWMKNVRKDIFQAVMSDLPASENAQSSWIKFDVDPAEFAGSRIRSVATSVGPLLQTKWGQKQYYNNLCPSDTLGSGGHAVTGCVATAMAQIMKYHNHPASGVGSNSYTPDRHPEYGVQSANFGGTTYGWANMPNSVTATNNAVATLMYHCGVAVNMDYGNAVSDRGSSASTKEAGNAYITYFKYDSSITYIEKADYSDSEWINILKNELNSNRPVHYRGSGDIGGHSFVCDGYDEEYFHFNWGWEGKFDGNFLLIGLTPDSYSFTDGQAANIGIKPDTQNSAPDLLSLSFTINKTTFQPGETLDANITVKNNGAVLSDASYIHYYFKKDSSEYTDTYKVGSDYFESLNPAETSSDAFSYTIPSNATAGTYYFYCWIDATEYVNESDESNNTIFKTITISVNPDSYEPNDTSAAASIINVNSTNYAYITPSEDVDWFKVYLAGTGQLTLDLASLPADYDLYLYDTNGDVLLDSSEISGTSSEQVVYSGLNLSGYYYIMVIGYLGANHSSDSYSLSVDWVSGSPDLTKLNANINQTTIEPGETLDLDVTISNIGDGASGYSYIYYYFKKDSREYTDTYKLGSDYFQSLIPGATSSENFTYTIPLDITSGTYYLYYWIDAPQYVTESNESNNRYSWTITVNANPDPYEPNDSSGMASLISLNANTEGYITSVDDVDWYKIEVDGTGDLIVNLTGLPADYDLFLYDPNLMELGYSEYYGTSSEHICYSGSNMSGYYYVKIIGWDGANNSTDSYSLSVNFATGSPDLTSDNDTINKTSFQPGQTLEFSLDIKNEGSSVSAASYVYYYFQKDSRDYSDTYKIGQDSFGSLNPGAISQESFSYTIPSNATSGTYYFYYWIDAPQSVTESNESNNKYYWTLSVTINPDSYESNDTPETASSINLGSISYAYISPSDESDWFKIYLTGSGELTISLSSLPADYDVYLYDPNLNPLAYSDNAGTSSEQIDYTGSNLSGYYYIEIYGYNGANSLSDSYALTVNWIPSTQIPDELAVDFGSAYGLHRYNKSAGWKQLNTVDPGMMVPVDTDNDGYDELAVTFAGYGLYIWDQTSGFTRINTVVPQNMIRLNDGLAVDFGTAYGLYRYSKSSGWVQLNTVDPGLMVAVDYDIDGIEELAVAFTGYGLYLWDQKSGFTRINTLIPQGMARLDEGLAVDYASQYGLWLYSKGGGWVKLSSMNPKLMEAVDYDGDGIDELAVSFPVSGLYIWDEATGLTKITTVIPEGIIRLNDSIAVDFGAAYGLYRYHKTDKWVQLHTGDPGIMKAVDWDADGIEELAVPLPGLGLNIWDSGVLKKITTIIPQGMVAGDFGN